MPPLSPPGSPDSDGWYLHSYPDDERQIDIMCDYIHRRRYYPQESDAEASEDDSRESDAEASEDEEKEYFYQGTCRAGAKEMQKTYANYLANMLKGTIGCIGGKRLPEDVILVIADFIRVKRQNDNLCGYMHTFTKCDTCGNYRCGRCNTKFTPLWPEHPAQPCLCSGWKLLFKA